MHGSHKSKCYRLSIYIILFHMIITELLAIRQPFWIPKWSPFSNYVDVKPIYVKKIGQTYIVTRHINQVFALYKVEAIITEEFSELF